MSSQLAEQVQKLQTPDSYCTISERVSSEIKVKGSRFIATCIPVLTKSEALSEITIIKKECYDATHNCYAYRFGFDGLDFRFFDDGEPSGTAGKPILFSIQKAGVSDVLVVVTRYFGGTRLGAGGLARAYGDSADNSLNLCQPKPVYRLRHGVVLCTYEDLTAVLNIIQSTAVTHEPEYMDSIRIEVGIPASQWSDFVHTITQTTHGRAGVQEVTNQ